jgi:hypothetical protein
VLLTKTKPNYENGTTKKSEAFNSYLSIEPSTHRFLETDDNDYTVNMLINHKKLFKMFLVNKHQQMSSNICFSTVFVFVYNAKNLCEKNLAAKHLKKFKVNIYKL